MAGEVPERFLTLPAPEAHGLFGILRHGFVNQDLQRRNIPHHPAEASLRLHIPQKVDVTAVIHVGGRELHLRHARGTGRGVSATSEPHHGRILVLLGTHRGLELRHLALRLVGRYIAAGTQPGLSQMVQGRPDKVTDDIRLLLHVLPVGIGLVGIGFGPYDHPVGEFCMVAFVKMAEVVVTAHIQMLESVLGIVPFQVDVSACNALGDQAGGIQLTDLVAELFADPGGILDAPVRDFIADAPKDDGRMVPVPQHHIGKVAFPAFNEELGVVVCILGLFPHVGELVHYQQAQFVAGFQEIAGRRVVGAADGIVAAFLELAHPAVFGRAVSGGSQQAVVVMDAAAPEKDRLTVDAETVLGVTRDGANAETLLVAVQEGAVLVFQLHTGGIEMGMLRVPEAGPLHL